VLSNGWLLRLRDLQRLRPMTAPIELATGASPWPSRSTHHGRASSPLQHGAPSRRSRRCRARCPTRDDLASKLDGAMPLP
jgi:hypothetical protein